ncbi:MAG: hypothetical protein AB7K68_09265 [Bacteriovoracia bacterium]
MNAFILLCISLLLSIPGNARANFECLPGPEEECYYEEVWSTPEELEHMARNLNNGLCEGEESGGSGVSTGAEYEYHCDNGRSVFSQVKPDKVLRKRVKGMRPYFDSH